MQFHLNGFRVGDPELHLPGTGVRERRAGSDVPPPENVDVLIIGCGPAGLTLAAQLATFSDIRTCIVEQKPGPLELGQADGVACRTVEMFNAFGFAERVLKEAYWVNETSFWTPGGRGSEGIVRSGRIEDTENGLSEFPHVILNQARVHEFYLDIMRKAPSRLVPYYSRKLLDLVIDADLTGHDDVTAIPVTARLERTDPGHEGEIETIRARYVIGCDGARSAVRRSIALELKGDSANQAWGVMDVLAVTDFPDIRLKAVINSAKDGSVVLIPREGGYLVRIYVEMDKLTQGERVANRSLTVDDVIAAARRVFHPYTLDVREVAWWSIYEIGQRLCDRFDNLSDDSPEDEVPRVFIVGDACHTHSPKAGQGMNVSMQDAFNLGWKLVSVLQGRSAPQLLRSYSSERKAIAQELISFDKEWAALLSAPLKTAEDDNRGVAPAEVQDYFVRHGRYTAGTASRYGPSQLTAEGVHQELAKGFPIGNRFHSAPVIRLGDGRPMQLGHCVEADGRWRLFAFSGGVDRAQAGSNITDLCNFLSDNPASPILRHTPSGADIDSVIDLRAIFQTPHRDMELAQMHPLLLPVKGRLGLRDYEKMFCPDFEAGDIFDVRGIDRRRGCIVVMRPDQYVANVLPIEDYEGLSRFFAKFMLER